MKRLFLIPTVFFFTLFILYFSAGCGTGGGSSGGSSSTTTKCSTLECFLANMVIQDNTGASPVTVSLVTIRQSAPPTSTAASNPSRTPRITTVNGTTVTTTTTTFTLSTLYETTDTEQFDLGFEDPTGCTPAFCYHCPRNMMCSSMVCSHTGGDGRLAGSLIQTLGYRAEPADSTTTEDLQMEVNAIVGVDSNGNCVDPIDDTTDPANPTIDADALTSDDLEMDTSVVGPDAPGGINDTSGGGGSSGGGSSGGGSSGGTGQVCSASSSSFSGVTCGTESCAVVTAGCCAACTISACVSSNSDCSNAQSYYKTSDPANPGHYTADSATACQLVANCTSICYGTSVSCP